MAYAARRTETQRYATIGAVALIHLAAGAVLVNEFASPLYHLIAPPHLATFNVPPPAPPPPQPTASARADSRSIVVDPHVRTEIPPTKGPDITIVDTGPVFTGPTDLTSLGNGADTPAQVFTPTNPSPANDPASWATTLDYPGLSLNLDEHGTTKFRVTVGSDGRVKACEIVVTSGSKRLDQQTCRLVSARARFEPAKDKHGEQVVGTYTNSVRWVLPN